MSGFTEFTLGGSSTPSILSMDKPRWKPEKGVYRASFIWLPNLAEGNPDFSVSGPKVVGVNRFYLQKVGYFLDNGRDQQPNPFQEAYNQHAEEPAPSRTYMSTVVCFWPVNMSTGALDKARIAAGDFEIKVWCFSQNKANQLIAIQQEYPLHKHDLKITVEEPKFHRMSFMPCPDSLFEKMKESNPETFSRICKTAAVAAGKAKTELGQDLTIEQVRAKLTGSVGSPASPSSFGGGGFDASDMLDNVLDG